ASFTLITAGAFGWSCGATNDTGSGNSGGGDTSTAQGSGGDGGMLFTGSGGGGPTDSIQVAPQGPTLTVELGTPGQTVQFTATTMSGDPVTPKWSLSTPEAGLIDANGLFTSNGNAGGKITVTATYGMAKATSTLTINLHALEDPGAVTPGDQATLKGPAGQNDPAWTLWYPYDKTIFPRGIL